ncbi:hypothetical protein AB3S75_015240 [Citrus x aurantiifolia]
MEVMDETPDFVIKNKIIPSSSSTTTSPTSHNPHRPTRPRFPTHLDAPYISSSVRIICEILAHASSDDIESALACTGIIPTPDLVHEVLQLSYNSPSSAVDFFRWAGRGQRLSPYAWNLMVDVLGKNGRFEQMWNAVRVMKEDGVLSLPAFASIFDSYCGAGKYDEAVMSFDVMSMHGVEQDVVAVNSLLSAICRQENQTSRALEFLNRVKKSVDPDGDSFAILLEGWEKEGNVEEANKTFGEMVERFEWNSEHVLAYETFLITLIRGKQVDEALKFLRVMKGENCFPTLKFFSNALDILVKLNDSTHAVQLWDIMMVFHGAFPDSLTYNMIFECLIKNKKVHEVEKFFHEMIKNEWQPTPLNCATAITMLLDADEPEIAIEIWNYILENGIFPLQASANKLLVGLCNLGRLSDVRRFAEEMLNRRILIYDVTMHKLKKAFYNESRNMRDRFDSLERRWKTSQM